MPSAPLTALKTPSGKGGSKVVVNPLSSASLGASPEASPLNSSPSKAKPKRQSVAAFLGLEGQQRRDSALKDVEEPVSWAPDAVISRFADETARKPLRFTIDMLLAVGPSLLALYTVFDASTGQTSIYIDGCTQASPAANSTLPISPSLYECIQCNNDSPRFGVAYPESARPVLIAFSILSSVFLAGATYGLNLLRDRAIRYLSYGVYISSTARRNWLSALLVSIYVVGLAVLQVVAGEARQEEFSSKTLGPNGLCGAVASPYYGMALAPVFKAGNPTVVRPIFSSASVGALLVSLLYFLLNTVLSQAFTIRAICEGPSNLYTDASLRVALKKQHTIRRLQRVLHWQVMAIDLDRMSVQVLLELNSLTERPQRRLTLLRILFAPLILLNYFGSYSSYIGAHPFDRTYRKPEWGGRTVVEEILHRLWLQGKITKFRVRDSATDEKPPKKIVGVDDIDDNDGNDDEDEVSVALADEGVGSPDSPYGKSGSKALLNPMREEDNNEEADDGSRADDASPGLVEQAATGGTSPSSNASVALTPVGDGDEMK